MKKGRHAQTALQPAEASLLALLRRALFASGNLSESITPDTDWAAVFSEAGKQTVLALTVEAAAELPEPLRPPDSVLSGAVQQVISQVAGNERLMAAQDEIIRLMRSSGIPCAILKGASVAVLYPKPELRALGDIDLLVGEDDQDRVTTALSGIGYRFMEADSGYHFKLCRRSTVLEVHRALSYIPPGETGDLIRAELSGALDGVREAALEGHAFPVLQGRHQALSLILHMRFHILGMGLGLRQLCDYALFLHHVDRNTWNADLEPMLRRFGLFRFAAILAKTCCLYLGLPKDRCAWCADVEDEVCEKVIADFFRSGNFGRKDPGQDISTLLSAGRDKPNRERFSPLIIIRNFNAAARNNFPLCARFPVLLPVMWVYLPLRYVFRMKTGKRIAHPLGSFIRTARQRETLFREFGLFQPEKDK